MPYINTIFQKTFSYHVCMDNFNTSFDPNWTCFLPACLILVCSGSELGYQGKRRGLIFELMGKGINHKCYLAVRVLSSILFGIIYLKLQTSSHYKRFNSDKCWLFCRVQDFMEAQQQLKQELPYLEVSNFVFIFFYVHCNLKVEAPCFCVVERHRNSLSEFQGRYIAATPDATPASVTKHQGALPVDNPSYQMPFFFYFE